MASIEKRDRQGKVTWLARWRDETGRQRKRSFNRKIDAQRFATTLRNLVSLLRSVYSSAVLDRLVASSPVVRP